MYDEDIFAADILLDFDKRFTVRERTNAAFAEFDTDVIADGVSQRLVGGAAENFHE